MSGAAVKLNSARLRFEGFSARFDLDLPAGSFTGIIGPSGSGKTTLLNLIAGFDAAQSGRILIGGEDVTGAPPAARPVTMVFQDHNLFSHLDVETNVALGVAADLKLSDAQREQVASALSRVGLDGFGHRLPGQLSGGERQRVAIARASVRDRPVLLLDEPFAALGPALRADMLGLVKGLHGQTGMTIAFVTHNPDDAREACDLTAFVHDGEIKAFGPSATVFNASGNSLLADYLGG